MTKAAQSVWSQILPGEPTFFSGSGRSMIHLYRPSFRSFVGVPIMTYVSRDTLKPGPVEVAGFDRESDGAEGPTTPAPGGHG
ncbi:MAG: hypothetical protein KDJ83_09315, partial [Rhodobacteraceae bacterium]|nr:hypothetical protein [Paracoccaceae bacterium]